MKNRKLLYIIISSLLVTSFIPSGKKAKIVTWDDLSYVAYRGTYSPQHNMRYDKPIFSKDILKMHGTQVQITGYIIPIDTQGERFFLSANPNSSCYFCGSGDKHSVLELNLKNFPVNYKVDEYLTFEGTLETHTEMIYYPYSLENAVLVKED